MLSLVATIIVPQSTAPTATVTGTVDDGVLGVDFLNANSDSLS